MIVPSSSQRLIGSPPGASGWPPCAGPDLPPIVTAYYSTKHSKMEIIPGNPSKSGAVSGFVVIRFPEGPGPGGARAEKLEYPQHVSSVRKSQEFVKSVASGDVLELRGKLV
jgi:hypothetical protein